MFIVNSDDVSFIIYYGGKFQTLEDGKLVYNGGVGHDLVSPAKSLLQELPVSLYGQRLWYKLPFEDFKELKILCGDGNETFEKMCETSKWTNLIEIFMEADEDDDGNHVNEASDDRNEENGPEQNDETGADNGREENQMCEEEAGVEDLVSAFVDEEENDTYYQRTPPTSAVKEEKF